MDQRDQLIDEWETRVPDLAAEASGVAIERRLAAGLPAYYAVDGVIYALKQDAAGHRTRTRVDVGEILKSPGAAES